MGWRTGVEPAEIASTKRRLNRSAHATIIEKNLWFSSNFPPKAGKLSKFVIFWFFIHNLPENLTLIFPTASRFLPFGINEFIVPLE